MHNANPLEKRSIIAVKTINNAVILSIHIEINTSITERSVLSREILRLEGNKPSTMSFFKQFTYLMI